MPSKLLVIERDVVILRNVEDEANHTVTLDLLVVAADGAEDPDSFVQGHRFRKHAVEPDVLQKLSRVGKALHFQNAHPDVAEQDQVPPRAQRQRSPRPREPLRPCRRKT